MSSDDTSKLVISKIKQIDDTTLQNYGLKNENEFYLITDDKLPIDVGDKKIVLSANATNDHDVINKSYIDDRLSKSGLLHNIEINSGVEKVNNVNPVNGNINVYNLVQPLAEGTPYLKLIKEENNEVLDQIALSSDLSNYVSHVELNQRLPAEFETRLKPYILIDKWNSQNGNKTQSDLTFLSNNILGISSSVDDQLSNLDIKLTNIINTTSVSLSTNLKTIINELSTKSVYLTEDQEISGNKTFKQLIKYLDEYNENSFDTDSTNETLTPKKYVKDLHDKLNNNLNVSINNIEQDVDSKFNSLDKTTVKTTNINQKVYGLKTFVNPIKYEDYNFNKFNIELNNKTLIPKGYLLDVYRIILSNMNLLDSWNVKLSGNQLIDGNKTFKQYVNYVDNKYTDKETFKKETSDDTLVPKQFVLDIESFLNSKIDQAISTRMARNIGDIFFTTRLDAFTKDNFFMNGAVKCDGSVFDLTATNLFHYLDNNLIAYKTKETFDKEVKNKLIDENNYGFFIWDKENNQVGVPRLDDVFIQSEINNYKFNGHYKNPGLPNITGKIERASTSHHAQLFGESVSAYGAFSTELRGTMFPAQDYQVHTTLAHSFSIDASRCNKVYGKSNTVQPPTIKLVPMVQIANDVQDPAMLSAGTLINQFNNVLGEVNNLLDKLIN